jgi:oleandomycin transport system ATP-binding protein
VRPRERADLPRVLEVLEQVSGAVPTTDSRGTVSVPVPSEALLGAVFDRLTTQGIAVSELAVRLPSLDDVFFALTGHGAEDETPTDTRQEIPA